MKLLEKIKTHTTDKTYCRITTGLIDDFETIMTGYILDYSSNFILLQETDEFLINGYRIIPINLIKDIRFNNNDKYLFKIHKEEGLTERIELPNYKINLSNWIEIFKSLKKNVNCIISECEAFEQDYFCIGEIKRVNKKSVSIQYFDAKGLLDEVYTKHYFEEITRVTFEDRYSQTFSKYTRKRKK
ncbi:hypothetical protein [Winogradskyella poriferorum]|uniref:hypothetical protein n=1 Tax=Winogradskyella poriferorum TaxID=307627 RepID=UPI003D655DB0